MTDAAFEPRTIALIGFGEAGSALGSGLCAEGGWRTASRPGDNAPRRVIAIDTALDKDARGRALGEAARKLGIPIADSYTEALREADLIFSVVPGENALEAAEAAARLLKPGAIFLDICTVTGPMAEADAAAIGAGSGRFVDVAVVGSFHTNGHRAPLLLAGAEAGTVAAWMAPLGFQARVLGPKTGSASAVKMLRSVLMKGIEALAIESYVAAQRQNLLPELRACMGDVDARPFNDVLANLVATHVVHARRRWEEMGLVAQMLRETGVPPLMTETTERALGRTVDANIAPADGKVPTTEDALQLLSDRVVR